ncbi:MAG: hypothetical protein WCC48_07925, partial [Anaeromyxobacteraceae bacterium]
MRRGSPVKHLKRVSEEGGSRRALRASTVQLTWALDKDGRKVAAGRLDERSRRERAPFRCPGCGDPLVPH